MKVISKLWEGGKKKSVRDWMVIAVICGVLLLLMFFPSESKTSTQGGDALFYSVPESENSSAGGTEESRLKNILEKMENVGAVDVMITYESNVGLYETSNDRIAGIVVVCNSDCGSETVLLIHEVIQALFPVPAHKIKVVKGISS